MSSIVGFDTYIELSRLLRQLPVTEERQSEEAVSLVRALISGRIREPYWYNLLNRFLNKCTIVTGNGLIENMVPNDRLLDEILEACDDHALDALLAEYSEDSLLGQEILKARHRKPLSEEALRRKIREADVSEHQSFYDLLKVEMDRKNYANDADFYNSIHFSRKTFSKMRTQRDYVLSKDSVLWLAAGLGLDYWASLRLLQAQGYTFRHGSRRDTIIVYVMKNGQYTLDELNEMLYFFGEKALGESRAD